MFLDSYDLEFTVAQNLTAVSSGSLLYQVRKQHFISSLNIVAFHERRAHDESTLSSND